VLAKFVVITVWSLALIVMIYLVGLVVGAAVGLPAVPTDTIVQGSSRLAVTAVLTIVGVAPIIFFASAGRGYLPPMGVAILTIFLGQITAIAGWGEYFPWAVPALYAQGAHIGMVSYLLVILTGIVGITGTFIWWENVDQTY
jgi:ABC-2 type transport system permease protein